MATVAILLLLSMLSTRVHAFTNGQSASIVIGQPDFSSPSAVTSQNGLSDPFKATFDSSGNLWVTDSGNNRLLEFRPPFSTGMSASLVIGQETFTTRFAGSSQNGLYGPGGLDFDAMGNLWVADVGNNRLLEFKPPFSTGMSASMVIGQKNLNTTGKATTRDGLASPLHLAIDRSGNLWTVDQDNIRVLEFKPPFSSGMNASLVIGQANFESAVHSRIAQNAFNHPTDLAFDSSQNLIVIADGFNNRVLGFKPPFSNGMNASLVIGQSDFMSNKSSVSKTGLKNPEGVGFDPAGNLWIADTYNNRLLEFQSPFSSGMPASLVIGQQDFTTGNEVTSQSGFYGVGHPAFDSSGNLWVVDFFNNRILEFSATPVPEFPMASLAIIAMVSLGVVALISRTFSSARHL